jgi:hypothetical protein
VKATCRGLAKSLILPGCLLLPLWALAAEEATVGNTLTAAVHGKMTELGSRDPLSGALLEVLDTPQFAESNAKGLYHLITTPGSLKLRYTAVGYAPVLKNVRLDPGQDLLLNISLDRVDFTTEEIVIRGKKDPPQVIATSLSQHEIKRVPGTAGDALRAVQNLPGIAIPNDYSGQLVVQGGGPNDNLYLIDNIPWPFPFHFGGILSTVSSDLLSSVDLYAAGFGARWGGILGAVLNGKTRAGQKDRLHASVDISLVTTQGLLEGPLGLGDASFTLAGRRSYFDLFIAGFAGSAFTALPYFWDLGGSLDFSLDPSNHVRVLALGSDDVLGVDLSAEDTRDPAFAGEFRLNNRAFTSGFSWINTGLPGLTSTLTPYYYRTHVEVSAGAGLGVDNQTSVVGLKEEAEWRLGEWLGLEHELGFGGSVAWTENQNLIYFYKNFVNGVPADLTSSTITARSVQRSAYVLDRIRVLPTLFLTAGLNYGKRELIAQDVITPRLSAEWAYDRRTLWKAAWGRYYQFPGGLQTNPDFGNPQLSANLSEHSVLSLEKKYSPELTGRVDAYYKEYFALVVNDPMSLTPDNRGLGTAKGVELFLRYDAGQRFFGWISYAYSRSERLGPPTDQWSVYQYDQPHILTLVSSYSFDPAWSLGAKLHYNSGPLVNSLRDRYQDPNGIWRAVFSDTYDQRLEDYLRLDLRMDYAWRFEGWRLNAYIEILNLLNRPNPAGLSYSQDYSASQVIYNLPRIPYIGLQAQF